MPTGWKIDGTDLRTLATNIRTVDGWDSWPGRRGRNFDVPYVHGESSVSRKFLPAKDISLAMTILPSNPAGAVTKAPDAHVQENLDTLLGLLWKPVGLLTVERRMPDFTVRTARAEAIDLAEIRRGRGPVDREFLLRLRLPDPLWRQTSENSPTSQQVLSTSQGFNVVTGGNGPIGDAVVRFAATAAVSNPRLEWTPPETGNPEYVQYSGTIGAGDYLDIYCGRRIAVFDDGSRGDAGLRFAHPWLIELPPATTVPMTATCSSATDWTVTVTWDDRWF